jgi:hypothetical protein
VFHRSLEVFHRSLENREHPANFLFAAFPGNSRRFAAVPQLFPIEIGNDPTTYMQAALRGERIVEEGTAVMETTTNKLALRPRDAAKALGISARTLWGLTAPRGPIPCLRIGHGKRQAVLYPLADLREWMRAQVEAAKGGDA